MSGRLVRRVLQEREASPQDPAEDALVVVQEEEEEEEAGSPTRVAARNPFDLLDDDDDEPEEDKEDEVHTDQTASYTEQKQYVKKKPNGAVPETNKKSKKKKKKGKAEPPASAKSRDEKSLDSILEDLAIEKRPMQKSVHQNDRATGKEIETIEMTAGTSSVLAIDPKHLKAENEMRRIFGSKVVDSLENQRNMPGTSRQVRGVRRAGLNPRRTLLVSPPGFWPAWDKSMSMDLVETKGSLNYFRYVYDPSVSHVQELFEAAKSANDLNAIAAILAKYPYHPDSLLTFADLFKYSGEHQSSADAVEKCLFALECAWHPLFNPLQGNYQLKYSHDLNKPFFTALFCHMKNLDRRGCHRSALEACKFLLSLDSDDPKGALFCIDYFALRSQQYKWLEQFAEEYQSTAVDLMKQALMLHPLVLSKIVD
uniref:Transcription factor 25 n=1 Tax=Triticum urartu TaxID=4572 RepID=A0A8R7R8F2_TRIUA